MFYSSTVNSADSLDDSYSDPDSSNEAKSDFSIHAFSTTSNVDASDDSEIYWKSQEDSEDTESAGRPTDPHSANHHDESADSPSSDDAKSADSDENPEETDNTPEPADDSNAPDVSTPSEARSSAFSRNSTTLRNGFGSRKPRSIRARSSRRGPFRPKAKSSAPNSESQGPISSAEDMLNLIAKRKKEKARALARRGLFSLFFEPKPE